MADNNVFFEKVAKQLFIAGAKKVFPSVMAPIAGVIGDEGFGYLRKKVKENDFKKEYEETIKRLYPGKYEMINSYVERIKGNNNLWQTLLDDEFDFEKVANTLIKKSLLPQEVRDLDDMDVAGIKISLIIMIERSYETLCSLDDEDVKKWLVEQTAKNGHSIEKQEIKIEELRQYFNQKAATAERAVELVLIEAKRNDEQDRRLDNHEARLVKVEKGIPKGIPDRAATFKARWDKYLFLEDDKENPEDKKKLSDVYIIPQVKDSAKKNPFELNKFLKKNPQPFTLFLGQPGVGKSTLISAYLNGVFGSCDVPCSVFRFSDFADRNYWNEKTGTEIAEEFYSEIDIRRPMDLRKRTIFLDGFDEISLEKTKRVDFLAKLAAWQNDELVENSKIIVTCRTNYMEEDDLESKEIPTYEIQPFDEEQIEQFCKSLRKGIHQSSIDKLKEREYLYGFPALLYIVLVLRLYELKAENTVEIYKELFSKLYKRSWDNGNKNAGHRFTTEHKSFYNCLAQRIAVYMYQHRDAADGCPIDEIERFGEALKEGDKDEYKKLPSNIPVLIDGFYQSRFLENDQIKDFIHRTIYEYFFTQYLFETVKENKDKTGDWFVQKFCSAMQYRELSGEMQQYFLDHARGKKDEIVGVIKKELEKALDNEMLSTETKYLQRSRYETYVLANCLSIISKAYDSNGYWKVESENSGKYLRLFSHTDLGIRLFLSKINLEEADLKGAYLKLAHLETADLERAHLEGAYLGWAHLECADLECADLKGAHLVLAHLEGAHLECADLERADLELPQLECADLERADLERAHLEWANLKGAHLERANLEGANLTGVYHDEDTVFPEGFSIWGKKMKLVMSDGRIKDSDSNSIIQVFSADEQNRTEES